MSYSQAKQDLFVLEQTKNKHNGLFLEIGGNAATSDGNNTYLLESQYNWNGISIELDSIYNYSWQTRTAKYFNMNALDFDYEDELKKLCGENSNTIDYLSLDLDPPDITYECLMKIPFDKFNFSVITYEHDRYRVGDKYRNWSRKYLLGLGYTLKVADVRCPGPDLYGNIGSEFEDWYIKEKV